jgi:N-methylhydantoinase A/oxoprolinase/acetone carboxylase beta subunit
VKRLDRGRPTQDSVRAAESPRYRLGFDIGGTFTDLVLLDARTGDMFIGKILSTPADPSVGAIRGIERLLRSQAIELRQVSLAIHATTLVSNAIIERRGSATALITTQGFRDLLEIGTGRRYDMHDYFLEFPEPIVPRRRRHEVPERVCENGDVLVPLDLPAAQACLDRCVSDGIEAIAICFLHSHANPEHEALLADHVRLNYPDFALSVSSELVGEVGEIDRISTTVANAYVQPIMRSYLDGLRKFFEPSPLNDGSAAVGPPFFLMTSSGGTTSVGTAQAFPIQLVESGPAAGALAAGVICEIAGIESALSFDMGGTTAKACLVERHRPSRANDLEVARVARFKKGSGLPLKVPVMDLIEIGAGGGSIARVDELGLLKVGPESAAADPGPACYRRGGKRPTVTDANLVLGYLNPSFFLGGEMQLDPDRARTAIETEVGRHLGLDVVRAAWGIHEIVNESMADAARVHIAERNRDPRDLTVIAFGGAGPAHACAIARKLRAREVVVPLAAGAASALGLLVAPPAIEYARSFVASLNDTDWVRVRTTFEDLEARARTTLLEMKVKQSDIVYQRSADLRYVGQLQQIRVDLPREDFSNHDTAKVVELFSARYQEMYSLLNPEYEVEALSLRVRATGPRQQVRLATPKRAQQRQSFKGTRLAYFDDPGTFLSCDVFDHHLLRPAQVLHGPVIIEQRESTMVVGPGFRCTVDEWLNARAELSPGGSDS